MADLLVDTDILIDAGRQIAEATEFLDRVAQTSSLGISCITQMELLAGCRNKIEQRRADRFLDPFEVVPISAAISMEAVGLIRRYRLSHGLAVPDGLIAATALQLKLPLATKNVRDFRFISGLSLVAYP